MAAITIWSDFGAPQNKVWHCFHCFPIYLPWSDGTGCQPVFLLIRGNCLKLQRRQTLESIPWWLHGKERCRRHRFDPWVGKISGRRTWQPTPVFLPGESMYREAWQAMVHRVAKSWTQLKWLSTRSCTHGLLSNSLGWIYGGKKELRSCMTTSAIEVCAKFSRKRVKGKHSSASKNERDLHRGVSIWDEYWWDVKDVCKTKRECRGRRNASSYRELLMPQSQWAKA